MGMELCCHRKLDAYFQNMESKFFKIIVHTESSIPTLLGICAGFENGQWRGQRLTDNLFNCIPDFCLSYSEVHEVDSSAWMDKLRKASAMIYNSPKFKSRGEFGELLLHYILKDLYKTIPAISKMYFKDSPNDTVKGFDAVHVIVNNEGNLDLWLGEVKFYNNASKAIDDVIPEIKEHFAHDYLRTEFIAITNKLDKKSPFYEKLSQLISPDTSLDEIFERICVPVLVTFNSKVIDRHTKFTDEYKEEMKVEMEKYFKQFSTLFGKLGIDIEIHLFLLPLKTKETFIKMLNDKLQLWQQI